MCKGGDVIFGDNSKCKIIGKGSIGSENSIAIHNVLLVKVWNSICLVKSIMW